MTQDFEKGYDRGHADGLADGMVSGLAASANLYEALVTLRSLVKEGGVPRYTVTPGAALNSTIEEVVDPAIRHARTIKALETKKCG